MDRRGRHREWIERKKSQRKRKMETKEGRVLETQREAQREEEPK